MQMTPFLCISLICPTAGKRKKKLREGGARHARVPVVAVSRTPLRWSEAGQDRQWCVFCLCVADSGFSRLSSRASLAVSGKPLVVLRNARLTIEAHGKTTIWKAWTGDRVTRLDVTTRNATLVDSYLLQNVFPVRLTGIMTSASTMQLVRIQRSMDQLFRTISTTQPRPIEKGIGRIDMHLFFVSFGNKPGCGTLARPTFCREYCDPQRFYRTIQTDDDSVAKFYSTMSAGGIVMNTKGPYNIVIEPSADITQGVKHVCAFANESVCFVCLFVVLTRWVRVERACDNCVYVLLSHSSRAHTVTTRVLKAARRSDILPPGWNAFEPGRNFFYAIILPGDWVRGEFKEGGVLGYGMAGRNMLVTVCAMII